MYKSDLYQLLFPHNEEGAVVITDELNMRYLSGFRGGEGMLFISKKKNVLITDSRYTEAASQESDFEVIEEKSGNRRTDILKELIKEEQISVIAYEDLSMRCSEFVKLRECLTSVEKWIPVKNAANDLRRIKSSEEISDIKEAFRISVEACTDLLGIVRPGMTEKEARAELEYRMMKKGASGLAFDTIVASGENSSKPHAVPTDRAFAEGDFITFDFGCRYDGYCSDMTRTIALGAVSDEQAAVYDIVLKAQTEALSLIRPGAVCKDVDAAARKIISDAGYGKYFGHGLGHSLGLFIHESPSLSPSDGTALEPGMLVTVEPGIYLPGKFGVRIEDTVLITENGYENLVSLPK